MRFFAEMMRLSPDAEQLLECGRAVSLSLRTTCELCKACLHASGFRVLHS
jgi:hypothetical protein